MATCIPYSRFQAFDNNGEYLIGGKLYTYEPSTSTDKATYSDAALTTPNTNPVILDARGSASVFGSGDYKLYLTDADDVLIITLDGVSNINSIKCFGGSDSYITSEFIYPECYGAAGDGATDDTGAIEDADAAGVSTGLPVIYTKTYSITDDITLSAKTKATGTIAVATGKTLTINGPFSAGLYQVFDGDGSVVFGAGAIKEVYPEWWAANTTPGTTDMTSAIESAIASIQTIGGKVKLLSMTYAVADLTIPVNSNGIGLMVEGSGQRTKIIPASGHTSGNYLITCAKDGTTATQWVTLRDFYVDGGSSSCGGIDMQRSNNCRAESVTILSCRGVGFRAERPYDLYCTKLRVKSCGDYANSLPGVLIEQDADDGSWGNFVYWQDNVSEANEYRQIEIIGVSYFQADGGKVEGMPLDNASFSHPEYALSLAYIDGGSATFNNFLFDHVHYDDAIIIRDNDGVTPGGEAYSRVLFTNCWFTQMESYNAGVPINVIEIDTGDAQSLVVIDDCWFDKGSTAVINSYLAGGHYIHVGANAYKFGINISGSNVFVERTDPSLWILDERTAVSRELGPTAKDLTAWQLNLGGSQTSDVLGSALTIASGAITITGSVHRIATEAAAASDDLVTINGGRIGTVLILMAGYDSRTIVVKHGTGNIYLNGAADFSLDSNKDTLTLLNINGSTWVEIGRGDNG